MPDAEVREGGEGVSSFFASAAQAQELVRVLRALLTVFADGRAWLLLHGYSGRLENGGIGLEARQSVLVACASTDFIEPTEEDTLHEFHG